MKKILSIITLMLIIFITLFLGKVQAASLDTIKIDIDKAKINPGQNVTLTINFGKQLGAYTFDIAYDNKLLEYVSAEGGTPNDNGTRVRVTYYDSTGGTKPRENMKITFKAKEGIITSNPTDLSVTAEGLANSDASEQYDDIGVPIVKNITVEPKFEDYAIDLNYQGEIKENEPKDMTLVISSKMGKNYEHARIIAEATTPEGAQVTLKGTDENHLEHDIIQSGWGDASGYEIGGQDVKKVLSLVGNFTKAGDYKITIKLIDRDSSDAQIASKTFNINVKGQNQNQELPNQTPEEDTKLPQDETDETIKENNKQENLPKELPKTGRNIYITLAVLIIALITTAVAIKNKNKNKF